MPQKYAAIKNSLEHEHERSSHTQNGRKISFSVPKVYESLLEDSDVGAKISSVSEKIGGRGAKQIFQGLLRFSFLCQPVNESVTTTIFKLRWLMNGSDSRFAEYDSCVEIFDKIYDQIVSDLNNGEKEIKLIQYYLDNPSCPYDVPVDYSDLSLDAIHKPENVTLLHVNHIISTFEKRVKLREILSPILPKKILEKVNVSSYKTERSLTGAFKSNREYRWEVVAMSPQGATKAGCWDVEIKLLEQILAMENCPVEELPEELRYLEESKTLCPVMLSPLDFNDLVEEGNSATHGESNLQLGHLNPKSVNLGAHNKDNISWISKEGNRIQGNNSIEDIHQIIIDLSGRITKT